MRVFLIYSVITAACIISIFVYRVFPDSYIEGSELTPFKITSEYVICFVLLCSLISLYAKKDRFEERVFRLIAASIIVTVLEELAFTLYVDVYGFFNFMGHLFKVLSFYMIYKAIIETGFDDPYTLLFRELKQSEEALRQEATFFRDDKGRIYSMLGLKGNERGNELPMADFQSKGKDSQRFVQNIHGFIELEINENFEPVLIDGAVEEITCYNKEDFRSRNVKWTEIVMPEDRPLIFEKMEKNDG